jgi:hypothetical protein
MRELIQELFQPAAVVLGLVATVVSIVVALSQLTYSAALRRQVAFYREVVEAKQQTPAQTAVAASLQARALALLTARQAIPLHRFALPSIGMAYPTVLAFLAGRTLPDQIEPYGVGTLAAAYVVAVLVLAYLAMMSLWTIQGLQILRERVAYQFNLGVTSITVDTSSSAAHKAQRAEWYKVSSAWTYVSAVSFLWLATVAGLLMAGPGLDRTIDKSALNLLIVVSAVPVVDLALFVRTWVSHRRERRGAWSHPSFGAFGTGSAVGPAPGREDSVGSGSAKVQPSLRALFRRRRHK